MASPKVHRPQGSSGGDELVVESGGLITVKSGGQITLQDGSVQSLPGTTNYSGARALPFWLELPQLAHSTDGATVSSVTATAPQKCEIIDVVGYKTGAGSSGTTALGVVVTTSTDGNISNVLNMKAVVNTVVRAGTIAAGLAARASGAVIKATRSGSSGTSVAGLNTEITVRVLCLPRATT